MNDIEIYFDSERDKEEVLQQFIRLIRQQQAKFIIGTSGESGFYILKDAYERKIISEELYWNLQIVLMDMDSDVVLVPKAKINKVDIEGAKYTHIATHDGRTYLMRDYPEFNDPKHKDDEKD